MLKTTKIILKKQNKYQEFKKGFINGIGWSFGVTVGFVIVSFLMITILNLLGGLPLIGSWIAKIIEETQIQLLKRTPYLPR